MDGWMAHQHKRLTLILFAPFFLSLSLFSLLFFFGFEGLVTSQSQEPEPEPGHVFWAHAPHRTAPHTHQGTPGMRREDGVNDRAVHTRVHSTILCTPGMQ